MFLEETITRNNNLIKNTLYLHSKGSLAPDTYVIEVDTFIENAKQIKSATNQDLYFMLKQVGRNPYLAKKLINLGYKGCVAVDFREALTMIKHNIHLSNVGHLVQIPKNLLSIILDSKPDYVTCYTLDKIKEIDCLGYKQKVLLKVVGQNDYLYPAQEGGFKLTELEHFPSFNNVKIAGVTSFPCYLDGRVTPNFHTLKVAKEILESQGFDIENINAPSTNCCNTIPALSLANSLEPGHALSGTHPIANQPEVPCVIYLTEVSHNYNGKSYVYGGGYYRRSHIKKALVQDKLVKVKCPPLDSIDYHFMLEDIFEVSTPAIMSFRFQMFVTRSSVALLENNKLQGIYTPFGENCYV